MVLEAAACALPCIGTRIPGLSDAVADGETGILVPLKNPTALESAILNLAGDSELRKQLGKNAKVRARRDYSSQLLAEAQLKNLHLEDIEDPAARKTIQEILNYLGLHTQK